MSAGDGSEGRPTARGDASSSSGDTHDRHGGATNPFDNSLFDEEGRERIRAEVDRQRAKFRRRRAEINEKSGRNIFAAIAIGVALGLAMLASLLFVKQLFIIFGVAVVAIAVVELASAMRSSGRDVPRVPSVVVAIVVVPTAYYLGPAWQWGALVVGIAFVSLWRLVEALTSRPKPRADEVGRDILAGALIQIYVTFLGSFTVLLAAQDRGEFWVIGFLLVVISVDTGAYVFGLNFGKHKLAPRISPGKTWEGIFGAVVSAYIVATIVSITLLQQPWWFGFIMAPLLVATATIGDLTESMFKRDLGIKDMSAWLPGHGGFFDRIDSILPSGAVAFALYVVASALAT